MANDWYLIHLYCPECENLSDITVPIDQLSGLAEADWKCSGCRCQLVYQIAGRAKRLAY